MRSYVLLLKFNDHLKKRHETLVKVRKGTSTDDLRSQRSAFGDGLIPKKKKKECAQTDEETEVTCTKTWHDGRKRRRRDIIDFQNKKSALTTIPTPSPMVVLSCPIPA